MTAIVSIIGVPDPHDEDRLRLTVSVDNVVLDFGYGPKARIGPSTYLQRGSREYFLAERLKGASQFIFTACNLPGAKLNPKLEEMLQQHKNGTSGVPAQQDSQTVEGFSWDGPFPSTDAGFPNADEYYPSASRRLGESGVVVVQFCVNSSGVLTAEPTIYRTSGSSRLDQGALKLANAGSGHYDPGKTKGGCNLMNIVFHLLP
jgi:TonB family protein